MINTAMTEKRTKKCIADTIGCDVSLVHNDSTFTDDLHADSLDTIETIMAIESEFKIEIDDSEFEPDKNYRVQDLIDVTIKKLEGKG
tara:strand:- start:16 stop:276 length:261 start_codon:yes stop_codon:yes gene_type:complete